MNQSGGSSSAKNKNRKRKFGASNSLDMGRPYAGLGYGAKSSLLYLNVIFKYLVLIVATIVSLPVFIILSGFMKITNPGPLFYVGARMGKNKKIFKMYKFRTLPVGTDVKIGAELLAPTDIKLPASIRIMRDTRLDELPQLINILKGEMNFVGPRPERPEIYESKCRSISGYEKRFLVRPGLIGYAQLFTPHSTPKRIRSFIDTRLVMQQQHLTGDALLILVTVYFMTKRLFVTLYRFVTGDLIRLRLIQRIKNNRVLERIPQKSATIYAADLVKNGKRDFVGSIDDMNSSHIRFKAPKDFDLKSTQVYLIEKTLNKTKGIKCKKARCVIDLFGMVPGGREDTYVAQYQPIDHLNHYIIDQYFLELSVISPWRTL